MQHTNVSQYKLAKCCCTCVYHCWSCRSVYRRQDVCVAKVILWILTSCTYWWENRYPPPPPPYLADAPPYLADDPPPYLTDAPPPCLPDTPPPPWLDDVLSQVGFSSVCVKAGPHETCAAGTSFHCCFCCRGARYLPDLRRECDSDRAAHLRHGLPHHTHLHRRFCLPKVSHWI